MPTANFNIYNAYIQYMQLHHCIKPISVHVIVHVDAYNVPVWQPTSPLGHQVGGVSTLQYTILHLYLPLGYVLPALLALSIALAYIFMILTFCAFEQWVNC